MKDRIEVIAGGIKIDAAGHTVNYLFSPGVAKILDHEEQVTTSWIQVFVEGDRSSVPDTWWYEGPLTVAVWPGLIYVRCHIEGKQFTVLRDGDSVKITV